MMNKSDHRYYKIRDQFLSVYDNHWHEALFWHNMNVRIFKQMQRWL